mmetsp:Transcript_3257/g.7681  ORF Transcript_3257/g.7681 Transcript_3257/m.7681 type:complete len:525 (+) Transcript_3257:77-1651(+)
MGPTMPEEVSGATMPTAEDIRGALGERDDDELRLIGARLTQSCAGMEQALADQQAEQKELQEENAYIRGTIELMMKELQKLNIGSHNLSEPELAEGPLDFLGRMWEQVRPRDTGVAVSEHVGEIRKPVIGEGSPSTVEVLHQQFLERFSSLTDQSEELGKHITERGQELSKNLVERSQELGKHFSSAVAPNSNSEESATPTEIARQKVSDLHSSLSSAVSEAPSPQELGKHVAERSQEIGEHFKQKFSSFSSAVEQARSDIMAAAPEASQQDFSAGVQERFSGAWSFFSQARESLAEAAAGFQESVVPTTIPRSDDDGEALSPGRAPADGVRVDRRTPSIGLLLRDLAYPGQRPATEPSSSGPSSKPAKGVSVSQGSSETGLPESVDNAESKRAEAASASTSRSSASSAQPEEAVEAVAAPAAAAGTAAVAKLPKEEKEEVPSTVLIEARLKLADGTVATCRVSAADRCKDVAARFVSENSLKSWFEAPLKDYLMSAEQNAEQFPVELEDDLMEIKRRYAERTA